MSSVEIQQKEEIKEIKEIKIDVTETPKNTQKPPFKRNRTKILVENMLRKNRSANSFNSEPVSCSPDIYLTTDGKSTPSVDRKPYEMNTIGDANLWTDEMVHQLLEFSDICNETAIKCKKSSLRHRRIGRTIEVFLISLGALSFTSSMGTANDEIKLLISTVSGGMVALITSIQSLFKYSQRSETEASSCLELERMTRSIRTELSKSKELRTDPYKFIIKLENQREQIIKKIGIDDD